MGKPIRILHIVSSMGRGGAETLIMNIYRHVDRSKVQFDFVTHSHTKDDYDDEIRLLGGCIYPIPSLGTIGPYSYLKQLMNIMSAQEYAAVHAHTDYQAGFPALAAKICGIKKRISHSHSNQWLKKQRMKESIMFKGLQLLIRYSSTTFCSCSEEAALFLFGKKAMRQVKIIKNSVDLSEYMNITPNMKASILHELDLARDTKLIGHIGTFSESKNHLFILTLLKKIVEQDKRFIVLLIGDGPLRSTIEWKAIELGIKEHVRFLGVRTDIARFMSAFDVFLFPSKFEGFGNVMVEAQCAGTPCIASTAVPRTTDMDLGLTRYIPLETPVETWGEEMMKAIGISRPCKQLIEKKVTALGFRIQDHVPNWLELYGVQESL